MPDLRSRTRADGETFARGQRKPAAGLPSKPQAGSSLVGRHDEMAILERVWDAVCRTRSSRTVLVEGEAGIGKSKLVMAFTDHPSRKNRCLVGRADALESGNVFGAFRNAVRRLAMRSGEPALVGPAKRLLEELVTHSGQPISGPNAGDFGPMKVALRELLRGMSQDGGPVVVVLDDLHEADRDTLALAAMTTRGSLGPPVLLIGVARPDVGVEPIFADFVERAMAEDGGQIIRLQPLSKDSVNRLGASVLGRPPTQITTDYVAGLSQGSPLYAEELFHSLERAGSLTPGPFADLVPRSIAGCPDVPVARNQRILALPSRELRTAECAAVFGRLALEHVETIGKMTGLDRREVLESLAQLELHKVIVGDLSAGVEFAHPLLRLAFYNGLGAIDRAMLHDAAADLMTKGGDVASTEEIAIHVTRGLSRTPDDRLARSVAAARDTADHSPLVAAHWLGVAADLLPGGLPRRIDLLTEQSCALSLGSDTVGSIEVGLRGLRESRGDHCRALMATTTSLGIFFSGRPEAALDLVTHELEVHPSQHALSVSALYFLAQLGLTNEAVAHLSIARAAAFHERNLSLRAICFAQLRTFADMMGDQGARAEYEGELRALLDRLPKRFSAEMLSVMATHVGGYAGSLRVAESDIALADELRGEDFALSAGGNSEVSTALVAWLQGDWSRVLEVAELAIWTDEAGGNHNAAQTLRALQTHVRIDRGERGAAAASAQGLVPGPEWSRSLVVTAMARIGEPTNAIALLSQRLSEQMARGSQWLAGSVGDQLVERLLQIEAHERAERVVSDLSAFLAGSESPLNQGWLLRAQARVQSDPELAVAARELFDSEGATFETQKTSLLMGLQSGNIAELTTAYDGFSELGALPWQREAASALRGLGRKVHVPRQSARDLSVIELDVIRLVVEGHTNRLIAEKLGYSVKRIEAVLSGLYARFSLTNRHGLISATLSGAIPVDHTELRPPA